MSVRVRFAPSPTGSLHLGNALTAVANRRFADEHGGSLVLRIDDTDATRASMVGRRRSSTTSRWLGVGWDEGPVRQSERGPSTPRRPQVAEHDGGAVRDADGSLRLGGDHPAPCRRHGDVPARDASPTTSTSAITHVIRGSDHRPNEEPQQRIARAIGGELPEVVHIGLLLGEDGKKLSKRHGHASVADFRDDGIPPTALRAYLDELGLPAHDVSLDRARIGRLAIDAIAAMPDDELAAAAAAPPELRARCAARARSSRRGRSRGRSSRPSPSSCRRGAPDARAVRRAARRRRRSARRDRGAGDRARAEGRRRRPAAPPARAHRRRARAGALDGRRGAARGRGGRQGESRNAAPD